MATALRRFLLLKGTCARSMCAAKIHFRYNFFQFELCQMKEKVIELQGSAMYVKMIEMFQLDMNACRLAGRRNDNLVILVVLAR